MHCIRWDDARQRLNNVMGRLPHLDWTSYIPEICKYKEKWKALCEFAEEIMLRKEDDKRERERLRNLSPIEEEEDAC